MMRKIAVWATAATVATLGSSAMRAAPSVPSIFLGNLVGEGAFIQVVGLTYRYEREPWCTGTLIGKNLVLTAAHCVCDESPTDAFVGVDPEKGALGRSEFYPVEDVRSATPCGEDVRGRDFALVKLDRAVVAAQPLGFATDEAVDGARFATVVGYGATDSAGKIDDFKKRYAVVPMQSANCSGQDTANYGCIAGTELVAGKPKFADTCKGDSGGPLLIEEKAAAGVKGSLVVAGVTSRAVSSAANACGDGGVYSRMNARARAWISNARKSMKA